MVLVGIAVATTASFLASAALYGLPPVSALVSRASTPRPGVSVAVQMLSVLLRSLVVACLVAGLMSSTSSTGPGAGALLGLSLTTLPAALLLGAVIHENTDVPVAVTHLLDWTIKLVLTGAALGALG